MASQAVTSGANFLTTILLVRAMGLEEFGTFSLCFLVMMIVKNFLTGTVLTPMSTIGPKLSRASRPAYRTFLAANGAAFAFLSSVVLGLGALLSGNWFGLSALAGALAIANFLIAGAEFVRRYHFVYERPATAFAVDLARYGVQLAAVVALSGAWQSWLTAETALYALALGGGLGLAVGALSFGALRWSRRLVLAVWPRHWNFIKWMFPNVSMEIVQGNWPLFAVAVVLGEAELGLIRAIQSVSNILQLPMNAFGQIVPSLLATAIKRSGVAEVFRVVNTFTAIVLAVIVVFGGVLVLFAPLLFNFMGLEADQLLIAVLVAFLAYNASAVVRLRYTQIFQVFEKPNFVFANALLGAAVAAVVTIPLLHALGPVGSPIVLLLVNLSAILLARLAIPGVTRERGAS